jgi:hypothetical protein
MPCGNSGGLQGCRSGARAREGQRGGKGNQSGHRTWTTLEYPIHHFTTRLFFLPTSQSAFIQAFRRQRWRCYSRRSSLRDPGRAFEFSLPLHAMDTAALRSCIQATLNPDTNIRRQAELELKHVE